MTIARPELRDGDRRIHLTLSEGSAFAVEVMAGDASAIQIDLDDSERDATPCVDWEDSQWANAIINALHQETPDTVFLSAADVARRMQQTDAHSPARPIVHVSKSDEQMAESAAARVLEVMTDAIERRGRCRIALAGGSTPALLYRCLSSKRYEHAVDWSRIDWFWGDERWVPHDHPDSNYRMARESLLDSITVVAEQIHPMPTSDELTPDEAADEYETTLRDVFEAGVGSVPRFDLILLGLGGDGHTASLFPSVPLDIRNHRLVWAGYVAEQNQVRMTLTPRILNSARHIMFLVSGESKAEMVAATLYPSWENRHPAARVEPCDATVEWFVDRAAAANIDSRDFPSS